MSNIDQAQAIAAFNPMAPRSGFLQVLFRGPAGDNKSYIQIISDSARVHSFLPVSWPERDCTMLPEELLSKVGGESLWGFAFANEQPLVLPWTDFRLAMSERLGTNDFADSPLLQFDIVDTLNLESFRRSVFTRAFEQYRSISPGAAEHWRDRAILEPALASALDSHRFRSPQRSDAGIPYFRARINRGAVFVGLGPEQEGADNLHQAYHALQRELPEIFPRAEVIVQRRAPPASPPSPKPAVIFIVLVGRIRQGRIDRSRWLPLNIEVVDSDHFHPELQMRFEPKLTIILGSQSDWQQLVEVGMRMGDHAAVIVTLSTSVSPLLRDLQLQRETVHPTVLYFAPFATSTAFGRDPAQSIEAFVHLLNEELAHVPGKLPLIGQHSLLIREPMWGHQSSTEVICRLGARALRSGAVIDGRARLYGQGNISLENQEDWAHRLGALFRVDPPEAYHRTAGRRATAMLLVERMDIVGPERLSYQAHEGVRRLLEMRGWRLITHSSGQLMVADPRRQFNITILQDGESLPVEDPSWPAPGFGRSPVLVVHTQPKRERLLIGNRGQFLHIGLEDIALMIPETTWIWPILRRQLFESSRKATLGALRLAAALVVEAIKMDRVQMSFVDVDWSEVSEIMRAEDCERFVDFYGPGIERHRALLIAKFANNRNPPERGPAIVELVIDDDGPIVSAAVEL